MNSAPLLLSLPCRNGMVAERGLFREMRKRKGSPRPLGCWQASLVWQPEKSGELRGLQISHLISIPFRLKTGKRGWLPAQGWSLLMSLSYLVPAEMSFMRVMGAQWRILPIAAVLQQGLASHPQYSVFSHQWEAGRELGSSGALCFQRAS